MPTHIPTRPLFLRDSPPPGGGARPLSRINPHTRRGLVWAQPWHGCLAPHSAGSMTSPVDASPAGGLVGKGGQGEDVGKVMGQSEEGWGVGASGSTGGFETGGGSHRESWLDPPTVACRPCQWVGSPPEKEDHLQQRAAAGAGASVCSTALPRHRHP